MSIIIDFYFFIALPKSHILTVIHRVVALRYTLYSALTKPETGLFCDVLNGCFRRRFCFCAKKCEEILCSPSPVFDINYLPDSTGIFLFQTLEHFTVLNQFSFVTLISSASQTGVRLSDSSFIIFTVSMSLHPLKSNLKFV